MTTDTMLLIRRIVQEQIPGDDLRRGFLEAEREREALMSAEQAAQYLCCTVEELYSLTRSRRKARGLEPLPAHRVGRRLVFRRSEIDQWLVGRRHKQ